MSIIQIEFANQENRIQMVISNFKNAIEMQLPDC